MLMALVEKADERVGFAGYIAEGVEEEVDENHSALSREITAPAKLYRSTGP
jgi:hypothetical protein